MGPCPWCGQEVSLRKSSCDQCGVSLLALGRYKLESYLRHGRGSDAYLARSPEHGHVCVEIQSMETYTWDSAEELERGVAQLRGLDHPSLAKVYAFERDAQGRMILVREYLKGGTLAERISARQVTTKEELEGFLRGMLELVGFLQGLVPPLLLCDLSPERVFFRSSTSWSPVIADITGAVSPNHDEAVVALMDEAYAAPELAVGEVNPSADLYSIGALMVQLVGQVSPDLFERAEADTRLASLEPRARAVVLRLFSKDPKERFQRAAEAIEALSPGALAVKTGPEQGGRWLTAGLFVAAGAALLVAVFWSVAFVDDLLVEASTCGASAVRVEASDDAYCVVWGESLVLGCSSDEVEAHLYCNVVDSIPSSSPGELDERGAERILKEAAELGLEEVVDKDRLMTFVVSAPENVLEELEPPQEGPGAQQQTLPERGEVVPSADQVVIAFHSRPEGATFLVNGDSCMSPCEMVLPKGKRFEVEISRPGYATLTRKLRTLESKTFEVELKK